MAYFLTLPTDDKYQAKLDHKKAVLRQRGRKIFDAKQAKLSYDVEELSRQVAEKQSREAAQRSRDATFDQATKRLDIVHQYIQRHEQDIRRGIEQDLYDFRTNHQRREDSATFEFNDPHKLRNQRPIGEHGDFSKFGPSSLVTFESDRIRQPDDLKDQLLKQQEWLAQQMAEQAIKKDYERHLDNIAYAEMRAQEYKMQEVETATQELQKAMTMANDLYNKALERHHLDLKRRSKELDEQDNKTHSNNTINSSFLNEKSTHPRDHRKISPEQQALIYETWKRQVQERRNARIQEKEEDATWDNYFRAVQNEYMAKMDAIDQQKEFIRQKNDVVNRFLAKEAVEKQDAIRTQTLNVPTDEYYSQWQRDPR